MPLSDLETVKRCLPPAEPAKCRPVGSIELEENQLVGVAGPEIYKIEGSKVHYSLRINKFSLLPEMKVEKYDGEKFEAGGYKWSLKLYPNGDKDNNGAGHISLYLAIEDTECLPHGWEVFANFRLFLLDQMRNEFFTVQDESSAAVVRRFHEQKREWGFAQLISLDTFRKECNGFIVDDSCIFAAEVSVVNPTVNWESITMIKLQPPNNKYTWTLDEYSKRCKEKYESDPFTVGGNTWKLSFYPKGESKSDGKFISLFLAVADAECNQPPKRKFRVKCKLRVLDQLNQNHKEVTMTDWYILPNHSSWGKSKFLPLEDLQESCNCKGFILKDSVIVEVEFLVISEVKFSTA